MVGRRRAWGGAQQVVPIIVAAAAAAGGWFLVKNVFFGGGADLLPPSALRAYSDPSGDFTVAFPLDSAPKTDPVPLPPLPPGVTASARVTMVERPACAFGVFVYGMRADDFRNGRTDEEIADDALRGAFANNGGTPSSLRTLTRGRHPVRRAEGKCKAKGRDIYMMAEVYIFPDKWFMSTAMAKGSGDLIKDSSSVEKFFASFRPTGR